ncbi:hypothetical protein VPH35_066084 [Triticum aestivum]
MDWSLQEREGRRGGRKRGTRRGSCSGRWESITDHRISPPPPPPPPPRFWSTLPPPSPATSSSHTAASFRTPLRRARQQMEVLSGSTNIIQLACFSWKRNEDVKVRKW